MIFKTAVSLLFVATALHVRAAPPVPAAPPLPVGVAVNIVDFQGNVFDINGRLTAPLTAISTLNYKPGEPARRGASQGRLEGLHSLSSVSLRGHSCRTPLPPSEETPVRRSFAGRRYPLCGILYPAQMGSATTLLSRNRVRP
ncbi:hypothetical protein B0H13DRAFT_687237 [Mycena leptocephala]|nr:hypothetical protein B0H13DRAFT_687237 [Mycena leptocephala]